MNITQSSTLVQKANESKMNMSETTFNQGSSSKETPNDSSQDNKDLSFMDNVSSIQNTSITTNMVN